MGNVQTSVNTYNITGDGNSFTPTSDMTSTAAPAIDLKPGVLNPTGKLWRPVGTSVATIDSLAIVSDRFGQYSFVNEGMRETFSKALFDINMWQPLFQATKTGCGPIVLSSFTTTTSGYVGATAGDALDNPVTNGVFISTVQVMNLQRTIAARMRDVALWQQHLDTAMTMLTPDISAGSASCNWKSLLAFAKDILPLDNLCLTYPNEFYNVAIHRYPALKPGNPDTKLPDAQAHPLGEVAGAFNAATSEVGSLVGSSSTLSQAISTMAGKDLDLIEADTPLPVSVFTPSLAPRSYRPAFIKPEDAKWIAEFNNSSLIRKTLTYSGATYAVQLGPGPTRVIDMNAMIDSVLTLDVSGTILPYDTNPDLSTSVPAFVLIQTSVPIQQVTTAANITAITVVSAAGASAINLAINVRGQPRFNMLHLQATFERETITGIPYIYGLGTFLIPSPTSSSNFSNPTLMDGLLTVTPVLLRETTYKGEVVDAIVPATVMANQTSEEVASALANDAIVLVSNHLNKLANVVGDAIPVASKTDDSATSAIVSRLAVQHKLSQVGQTSPTPPDYPLLWRRAKRAASMFVSNPSLALQVGIPVLTQSGMLSALTSGVGTALRTGSLGKGVTDASEKLRARQSLTVAKQAFFDQIGSLWPGK
ncbi:putative outer capsid VP4 [Aquareovirus ctenopharyngodontis]|uniref:Outer capsid protein VP4 n=1 Tax=Aquareovirus C (isolate Golden shiner/USA/GSRV/1977) TaxID=185783 RepID=VP4_AQRVC|nr:putative outer capsid VP4 [Aquareovirus C]Q8JU57.1 RecName: Full=Outer capsid protein VP4 [Golden shiner reovirus]AAM92749.1 putative outer capsid VP4 [Golden shiner reovirus]